MKKTFIYLVALLTLSACSKEESEDQKTKEYTTDLEHFSYQVGFPSEESGNLFETNEYATIAIGETWKNNWDFIPSVVKKPDVQRLLYSYDTQESYKIFETTHYYTVTHNFYAYYSAIIEWDNYNEVKTQNNITQTREIRKNLKSTVKYVGCTKDTPSKYLPTNTSPEVITYPDQVGEWVVVTQSPTSEGSTTGSNNSTREYRYHSKTSCYKESTGEKDDDLYIYKKDYEYRASWTYDSKGLPKEATYKINTGSAKINGTVYTNYICPFGISFYFNYNK